MGCWDVFCVLCGNTYTDYELPDDIELKDKNLEIRKKLIKESKWLESCIFLSLDNRIAYNCKELSCSADFGNNEKAFRQISNLIDVDDSVLFSDIDNCGVFVHSDCWKYVYQTRNIKLKYGDLPINRFNLPKNHYKAIDIDYGKIEKYWSQFFEFEKMIKDKNEYMCQSPLINKQNAKRIDTIINKFNLTPSNTFPSLTPLYFVSNTIKIGNDGNFWIVKNNKWQKLDGKIIKEEITVDNKSKLKLLNLIPQVGEFNTRPYFIESFIRKDNQITFTIKYMKSLNV